MTTSWARSRAPSLDMALLTWVFTVRGLTSRRSAISSFERPCGDLDEDLAFAHGEGVEAFGAGGVAIVVQVAALSEETGDQALGRHRRQQGLSGRRDPDRAQEFVRLRALAEEAGRARAQGLHHVVVDLEGRQYDHADVGEGRVGADHAGRGEAVRAGHPDVHQHDVGPLLLRQQYGLCAVRGLSYDLHVGLRVDEYAEGAAQQGLVVGEQDTDRRHTGSPEARGRVLTGRIAWTRKPPP